MRLHAESRGCGDRGLPLRLLALCWAEGGGGGPALRRPPLRRLPQRARGGGSSSSSGRGQGSGGCRWGWALGLGLQSGREGPYSASLLLLTPGGGPCGLARCPGGGLPVRVELPEQLLQVAPDLAVAGHLPPSRPLLLLSLQLQPGAVIGGHAGGRGEAGRGGARLGPLGQATASRPQASRRAPSGRRRGPDARLVFVLEVPRVLEEDGGVGAGDGVQVAERVGVHGLAQRQPRLAAAGEQRARRVCWLERLPSSCFGCRLVRAVAVAGRGLALTLGLALCQERLLTEEAALILRSAQSRRRPDQLL